jgi:DNA primase
MNVKVLILPDGDDPDSFSRKHNATEFQQYINDHEENFIRFKTNLLLKDTKNDPIKRATLIGDMARSIGLIPNEIIRYACLKECASILNVDEQIILNEIKKVVQQRKDEYIEKRKKEQEEAAKVNAIQSAPTPENTPNEGWVPPPPFPPEEAPVEVPYESYLPQSGWDKLPFYAKEKQLINMLVRYGERIMCYVEGEDGEEIALRVTEYIAADLEQDSLQFHDPTHRKILNEAVANLDDANFSSERHFLAHPDPAISRLAADMLSDKYRLSKSNEQALIKDEERLHELIPRLLIDFKLAILEEDMKQTIQQLNLPEVAKDAQRAMEVMQHYKKLTETLKEMAKRAGDRVILKA